MSKLPNHVKAAPNGTYKYRRRIPDRLRVHLGQREINLTLNCEYSEMLERVAKIDGVVHPVFKAPQPSPADWSRLMILLGKKKGAPAASERERMEEYLSEQGLDPKILETAERLAEHASYHINNPSYTNQNPPTNPDDFRTALVDRELDALLEVIHDEMAGRYQADERLGKQTQFTLEAIKELSRGKLPAITLADVLKDYHEAKKTGLVDKDRQHAHRIENLQTRLIACLGDSTVTKNPVMHIRREHMNRFRDFLLNDGLAPSSADRRFNDLKAALNWAIDERDLDWKNPANRIKIKGAEHNKNQRLPLDDNDMALVDSQMDTDDDIGLIWALLRDTGARGSEIVGLRVKDIDANNISIHIETHDDRGLKTAHSVREIPIPEHLLARLIELTNGANDQDGWVFKRYEGKTRPGDSASRILMKRFRKHIQEPKKVAYSLRHRMKDKLREHCPESLAKEIMGHSEQGVAANYGKGTSRRRMRQELEKVWDAPRTSVKQMNNL